MIARPLFYVALPILALVGGCASTDAEYPSLAIREVERVSGTMETPEAPRVPAPPRATLDRLGPLAAEARAAHAAFTNAATVTSARVSAARGAPSGSENWSVAQVALGDLRSRRSTAMVALADLDRLYNDASSAGESVSEIGPVRGEVARMIAEEDAVLDRLIRQLAQ